VAEQPEQVAVLQPRRPQALSGEGAPALAAPPPSAVLRSSPPLPPGPPLPGLQCVLPGTASCPAGALPTPQPMPRRPAPAAGVSRVETSASATSLTSCGVLSSEGRAPAIGPGPERAAQVQARAWQSIVAAPLAGAGVTAQLHVQPRSGAAACKAELPLRQAQQAQQQQQAQRQAQQQQRPPVLTARPAAARSTLVPRPSSPLAPHLLPRMPAPRPSLRLQPSAAAAPALASGSDSDSEDGHPSSYPRCATPLLAASARPQLVPAFAPYADAAPHAASGQQRSIFDEPAGRSMALAGGTPARSNSLPPPVGPAAACAPPALCRPLRQQKAHGFAPALAYWKTALCWLGRLGPARHAPPAAGSCTALAALSLASTAPLSPKPANPFASRGAGRGRRAARRRRQRAGLPAQPPLQHVGLGQRRRGGAAAASAAALQRRRGPGSHGAGARAWRGAPLHLPRGEGERGRAWGCGPCSGL
jgi:hypothetical protein